jgi:predicted dehydrogenase
MAGKQIDKKRIRYAVVGLGWIAQAAILPAFKNAKENSELVALVSDDKTKLTELSKQYAVEKTYSYEQYDDCLRSGEIDAVFIALPNTLHKDYTVRAAKAGIHVLCEKPMAITVDECEAMIEAAEDNDVKLMIAYRLHFEEANLKAIEVVNSGEIGEARIFLGTNVQNVDMDNTRLDADLGGNPLDDMGIYCINAARYLFRAEPVEITAFQASKSDPKFSEVPEMVSVIMRFPGERLAQFVCGFGTEKVSTYQVLGTKGNLLLNPATGFGTDLKHVLTVGDKTKETVFKNRDQFAPELIHFSKCILENKALEPSGEEGLVDVRIIEAIRQSIESHKPVRLEGYKRHKRPSMAQEIHKPPVKAPELVKAKPPSH